MKNATLVVNSISSPKLNAGLSVGDQSPNFGGSALTTKISYSFNGCLTFQDSTGKEWSVRDTLACSDAPLLPDHPSACSLNYGSSLDIDMGTLERQDISTAAAYDTKGSVKKIFLLFVPVTRRQQYQPAFSSLPLWLTATVSFPHQLQTLGLLFFIIKIWLHRRLLSKHIHQALPTVNWSFS